MYSPPLPQVTGRWTLSPADNQQNKSDLLLLLTLINQLAGFEPKKLGQSPPVNK